MWQLDLWDKGCCDCGGRAVELEEREVHILRILHLAQILALGNSQPHFPSQAEGGDKDLRVRKLEGTSELSYSVGKGIV